MKSSSTTKSHMDCILVGEAATITTATPFNVDDDGEVRSGTLVRQHIAQLESQQ